jgi:hypothetical protein
MYLILKTYSSLRTLAMMSTLCLVGLDSSPLLIAVIAESLQDPNFPFVLLIFFHYQAILYIQTCRCLVSLFSESL